jgi:hypothetical protein
MRIRSWKNLKNSIAPAKHYFNHYMVTITRFYVFLFQFRTRLKFLTNSLRFLPSCVLKCLHWAQKGHSGHKKILESLTGQKNLLRQIKLNQHVWLLHIKGEMYFFTVAIERMNFSARTIDHRMPTPPSSLLLGHLPGDAWGLQSTVSWKIVNVQKIVD